MSANCRTCGAPLPSLSFGAAKDQCESCRRVHAAGSHPIVQRTDDKGGAQNAPDFSQYQPSDSAQAVAARRPEWQSATGVLIAINVAVFLLMVLADRRALMSPPQEMLIKWGADFGPLTLDNQPWRVITSGFLHIGIIHIAVNMWSLWILGRITERFIGPTSLAVTYLLTGIGASLASLAWNPLRVSAGASGPIFGFVGALMGIFFFAKSRMDPVQRKNLLSWVVRIAVINLFIGMTAGIDNMAHVGGMVTGAVVGSALVISVKWKTQDRAAMRRSIFVAVLVVLTLLFVPVRAKNKELLTGYRAAVALDHKDYNSAIAVLRQYAQEHPDEASAHASLGYVLQESKRDDEAAEEYKRALSLDKNQHEASVNLGIIYVAQGRGKEALPLFAGHIDKIKADAECYRSYGEALMQNGEPGPAEEMLRKAVQLNGQDVESHEDLARALTMQKKVDAAEDETKIAEDLKAKAASNNKQVKP